MKTYLMLLATIVALSISYYFAIALPANNRSQLDFEREKYRNEQAELKAKKLAQAEEAQTKEWMLSSCLANADKSYTNDVARNGTKDGKKDSTVYTMDTRVAGMLDKRRIDALAECHKQFGP
jgi:hypothetical protein